jgi:hypothetical protein
MAELKLGQLLDIVEIANRLEAWLTLHGVDFDYSKRDVEKAKALLQRLNESDIEDVAQVITDIRRLGHIARDLKEVTIAGKAQQLW